MTNTTPIKYEDRIISFADILGFANRVKNAQDDELPTLIEMISEFRDAFNYDYQNGQRIRNDSKDDIFLPFSDGFVRGRSNDDAPLFYEIMECAHGIMKVIFKGHFVRGSITNGKIFHDDETGILVSPAFIRAYDLEQKHAIYPRVIIDPITLVEFKSRTDWRRHSLKDESIAIYNCLRLDYDGYYFIDYLKVAIDEIGEYKYSDYIKRHKRLVEELIATAIDERVKQKGIWLANYHNLVLSELDGDWTKELKISNKLLRLTVKENKRKEHLP